MAYNKELPPLPKYADEPLWRGNSQDVSSRLVRAAWNMIFTKDPATVSLREVAHKVGVSAPAAYNHFRDRESLFAELAWGGLVMLGGELGDSWEGDELRKGLVPGICAAWLRFADKRPRHYALMFALDFNDPERYPKVVEKRTNLRTFLRRVVETELGFEPPTTEADLALVLIHGSAALVASGDPKPSGKLIASAITRQLGAMKEKR